MVDINHADGDQRTGQGDRHEGLPADAEAPGAPRGEQRRHDLDDRITQGNRFLAVGALGSQQQIAQYRDVLPGLDRSAALRAPRPRHDEVETALRQVIGQHLPEFFALIAPLALHHNWQTVNDDVQEAADHEGEGKGHGNECQGCFA